MKAWTFAGGGSGKPTEAPMPADHGRRGQRGARSADRDGRRGRRRADGEVLRRRHADAGGTGRRAEARRRARRASSRCSARRRRPTSASSRCSTRSFTTCRRRPSGRAAARRTSSRVDAADSGPASAFVWKTVADPFAGRITMFRVISGALKADSTLHNVTRETRERLGHLGAAAGQDADERARDARPATSARSPS